MKRACLMFLVVIAAADARGQALMRQPAERAATSATSAPATSPAPGTVFRSAIDLVALNVVVTDSQQKFVSGLAADDFAVYEDGVQQDVSFFAATTVPLDLAILLDTSASMTDKLRTVQQAATGFVATLRDGDRAMIVDIKDATRILQPLDTDIAASKQAIASTQARGGTALFNGLYLTLKELVKQRRATGEVRRQAIVVLSDGDDTASLLSYDDVMMAAKEAGIAIYTITLKTRQAVLQASTSGHRYFSQSEFAMKSIAQETGARSYFPTDILELAGVYSSIAEELANQYALGYTSKNPKRDGAFRRVIVQVTDRPGARTRTRSGYLSARAERKVALQ